jgi:hypothetical protein
MSVTKSRFTREIDFAGRDDVSHRKEAIPLVSMDIWYCSLMKWTIYVTTGTTFSRSSPEDCHSRFRGIDACVGLKSAVTHLGDFTFITTSFNHGDHQFSGSIVSANQDWKRYE